MWSIHLWYTDQCLLEPFETFPLVGFFFFLSCFVIFSFVFLFFFVIPLPALMWGRLTVYSNQMLLLPWSNHTAKKNGRHWQRRGMGPIILLTTDFIPRVKGLLSVTFTWFKSLAQLNQKSMKSFGYIFGLSCQHFKLGTIVFVYFFFIWFVLGHQLSKKVHREIMMAELWLGWNLTTHWKISPIAFMGLCRNGEYTRKTQNYLEEINI